ncbi:MAG: hypothetical protein QNK37_01560 [Acidobacteriota bacterium]|nr:hypothetical protein [Acidobacteriota bacterium]
MPDFTREISDLKSHLLDNDDFASVNGFFFQALAENASFLELGKPIRSPMLKNAFRKIAVQMYGRTGLEQLLVISVPVYKLYHGSCLIAGRPATFFFFNDLDLGLMAITDHLDRTEHVRFTNVMLVPDNHKAPMFFHYGGHGYSE